MTGVTRGRHERPLVRIRDDTYDYLNYSGNDIFGGLVIHGEDGRQRLLQPPRKTSKRVLYSSLPRLRRLSPIRTSLPATFPFSAAANIQLDLRIRYAVTVSDSEHLDDAEFNYLSRLSGQPSHGTQMPPSAPPLPLGTLPRFIPGCDSVARHPTGSD
ncbi:hypothetical protein ACWGKA_26300 [Streptomyces luteogriseus]